MTENELSRLIVDSAFQIHSTLGPGLYESVYEVTLTYELEQRGCKVVRNVASRSDTRTYDLTSASAQI